MPQFDAFAHPVPSLRRIYPLAVCLRTDLIAGGDDTLIAPLVPRGHFPAPAGRLAPVVQIDGEEYVVIIEKLTTVPLRHLPRRIANLSRYRESLLGAVDLLFYGV
jgi:toxin CcdB